MSAAAAAARRHADDDDRDFTFTDRDFDRVRKLIHARAGIALADSKRDMVYSRLGRRLRALALDNFRDYLDRLEARNDADEWQAFTNALTTNLTSFFRESHHFDILREQLAKRDRHAPTRLWCSAASTGEEPYSIAITACEAYDSLQPPVKILATDIDTAVLETAQDGVYAEERIEKLQDALKRRYFRRGTGANAGRVRVIDALRELIVFRPLNLLDSRYPMRGPFDAIFCRNVMIYFDKPTQRQILERMVPLMAEDALFFAGHSESFFHATDLVTSIGRTVYRRTPKRSG